MSRGSSLLIAGVAAGLVAGLLVVTEARAKSVREEDAADPKAVFAEGKRLYDAGKKQAAVEKFKEAYRLSRNPLLLYNVGFVFDELHDRPLAIFYYDKFLTDVPDSPKTAKSRAAAAERLAALRREMAVAELPAPAQPAPAPAPARKKLSHEVVDSALADRAVEIKAFVPSQANLNLTLYYRNATTEAFARVPMKPDGDARIANIPAKVVRGRSVLYYIEVADARGKPIARSGQPTKPHAIAIESAPYQSQREDENPLDLRPAAARRDSGGAAVGSDDRRSSHGALKWTFTLSAAALLGAGVVSYITAQNYQEALDAELVGCTGSCAPTTDYELELDRGRKNWQIASYAAAGAGVVSAGVATWLWLRSDSSPRRERGRIATMPLVGPDVVGATAMVRF